MGACFESLDLGFLPAYVRMDQQDVGGWRGVCLEGGWTVLDDQFLLLVLVCLYGRRDKRGWRGVRLEGGWFTLVQSSLSPGIEHFSEGPQWKMPLTQHPFSPHGAENLLPAGRGRTPGKSHA